MTAGAEERAGRPTAFAIAALICASAAFATSCTSDSSSQSGAVTAQHGATSTFVDGDELAIRRTIEAVNAAAADGVAAQQAALATLVDPTMVDALDDCPPATTTLRFEPTYPGVRRAPGWTGSSGPLAGTVYALPTLIRIYTGDRITGTDLTTLHLGVQASEAYLTPLCVG